MDTKWKVLIILLNIVINQVCNGYPINLENGGKDSHTQLLTGLIAVLLTICCIVVLAGCLCCTRNNGFKEFRDSPVVLSVANNLDHGHVNPIANGEFTIFTPLSPPHYNNNIFLANQEITRNADDYRYGDIDIQWWFDGTQKEFPRTKLKYIRELGKGWFGRVVEGTAQDLSDVQNWTPVVVRILDANSSTKDRILFLNDANIYRFGTNPNILTLLGRSLDTVPMLLIQEYCVKGDVKKYLKENLDKKDAFLTSELPLRWCYQISLAIRHLHHHVIVHPDLAARNCLIDDNLNVKVGDYGLSTSNYPDDYYLASPGLPIRWCSPESVNFTSTTIQPNKATLESNVWSFGVTMWEIFECGKQPYSNLNDDEVITQVLGPPSFRLQKPGNNILYTDYMYRLMQMCWTSLELRPKIIQIELMLDDLMKIYKNMNFDNKDKIVGTFDDRWNNLKPNTIVKTDNQIVDLDDAPSNSIKGKRLNGSLNNLLETSQNNDDMESWLENLATNTDDMSYIRGVHDAMNDLDNVIALENVSSSDSSHRPSPAPPIKTKLEFKLGPTTPKSVDDDNNAESLQYVPKTSSGSETEDENWKKKVEKGVYSEKVRQKSRSVTDLMVLTHIDCSESESETPLQSLDYRVNYKNVRLTQNLENGSLMYGSEGNLLSVQETFQEELRKLREKRKDSLLFVPVNSNEGESLSKSSSSLLNASLTDDKDTEKFQNIDINVMQDLSNVNDLMKPYNVYNVYNVTVESKFQPEFNGDNKLSNIINFHDLIRESKPDNTEKLPDIISDIRDNLNSSKYKLIGDEEVKENQNVDSNVQIGLIGDANNINFDDNLRLLSGNVSNNCPTILDIDHIDLNLDGIENLESSPNINNIKLRGDQSNYESQESDTGNVESHLTQIKEFTDKVQNQFDGEYTNLIENTNINVSDDCTCVDDVTETKEIERSESDRNIQDNMIETQKEMINSSEETSHVTEDIIKIDNDNVFKHDNVSDISTKDKSDESIKENVGNNTENLTHRELKDDSVLNVEITLHHVNVEGICNKMKNIKGSMINDFEDISYISSLEVSPEETPKNVLLDNSKSYDFAEHRRIDSPDKLANSVHSTGDDVVLLHVIENNDSIEDLMLSLPAIDVNLQDVNIDEDILHQNIHNIDMSTELCQKDDIEQTNLESITTSDCHGSKFTENVKENIPCEIDDQINGLKCNDCENAVDLDDNISRESQEQIIENNLQNYIKENVNVEEHILEHRVKNVSNSKIENNVEVNDLDKRNRDDKSMVNDEEAANKDSNTNEVDIDQLTSNTLETVEIVNAESNFDTLNVFDGKEGQSSDDNNIIFGSCSDYTIDLYSGLKTSSSPTEAEELKFSSNFNADYFNENCLNYSLDSWDNFLDKTFDKQYDNYNSDSSSLNFIQIDDNDDINENVDKNKDVSSTVDKNDVDNDDNLSDSNMNETFTINPQSETFVIDVNNDSDEWEPGEGWFLHNQPEELTGEMDVVQGNNTDSYVGFSMDDDVMSAIRNELLMKLPHAQRVSNEKMLEEEDTDTGEKIEVFIKFNTPLSPIPEESSESNSCQYTPQREDSDDDIEENDNSDWTEPALQSNIDDVADDTATHSPLLLESPAKDQHNRHTPSQDSCCSNDTLFNLEELVSNEQFLNNKEDDCDESKKKQTDECIKEGGNDVDTETNVVEYIYAEATEQSLGDCVTEIAAINENVEEIDECVTGENLDADRIKSNSPNNCDVTSINSDNQTHIKQENCEGMDGEPREEQLRNDNSKVDNLKQIDQNSLKYKYIQDFIRQEKCDVKKEESRCRIKKQNVPLPSPEDRQWKELHAPFLTYNVPNNRSITDEDKGTLIKEETFVNVTKNHANDPNYVNTPSYVNSTNIKNNPSYVNTDPNSHNYIEPANYVDGNIYADSPVYVDAPNYAEPPNYVETSIYVEAPGYVNAPNYAEPPNDIEKPNYVNTPNYVNNRNSQTNGKDVIDPVYVENAVESEERLDDIYGPLADIRFSGPCDNQLMSTSFSESNDLCDEQDWDSGSDTRSSSSGEFLWKHDEHEESVKALSVAPQELIINEITRMEENEGEMSESTGSEEDGDGPEFVPSAWDKYAIPSKSALRSPEKTLEKPEKKSKGVWFKKQKYHCVYEYPKEPESPILQSCDLWKPSMNYSSLSDWNLEQECYEPITNMREYDVLENVINDVDDNPNSTPLGGDFFISGSTRPFDNVNSLGSEFFPGKCTPDNWEDIIKFNDNITPDSGIDDLTPGSLPDINDVTSSINSVNNVQPLKQLAAYVVNKTNNQKVLGGLRHTRNKLKLDLPPSPTAFSATKVFTVEPEDDLINDIRSVPTFTTFGKSRFSVQHVDTPTDEKAENYKNVSFEVLPHKPLLKTEILKEVHLDKEKQHVEFVRGEASLLDSADEDSGIESCTLERKKMQNVVENNRRA